jgi:hypothetical protein
MNRVMINTCDVNEKAVLKSGESRGQMGLVEEEEQKQKENGYMGI